MLSDLTLHLPHLATNRTWRYLLHYISLSSSYSQERANALLSHLSNHCSADIIQPFLPLLAALTWSERGAVPTLPFRTLVTPLVALSQRLAPLAAGRAV